MAEEETLCALSMKARVDCALSTKARLQIPNVRRSSAPILRAERHLDAPS